MAELFQDGLGGANTDGDLDQDWLADQPGRGLGFENVPGPGMVRVARIEGGNEQPGISDLFQGVT